MHMWMSVPGEIRGGIRSSSVIGSYALPTRTLGTELKSSTRGVPLKIHRERDPLNSLEKMARRIVQQINKPQTSSFSIIISHIPYILVDARLFLQLGEMRIIDIVMANEIGSCGETPDTDTLKKDLLWFMVSAASRYRLCWVWPIAAWRQESAAEATHFMADRKQRGKVGVGDQVKPSNGLTQWPSA